jgi:hypothetical protein
MEEYIYPKDITRILVDDKVSMGKILFKEETKVIRNFFGFIIEKSKKPCYYFERFGFSFETLSEVEKRFDNSNYFIKDNEVFTKPSFTIYCENIRYNKSYYFDDYVTAKKRAKEIADFSKLIPIYLQD